MRDPLLRRGDRVFEVWADGYVRNESPSRSPEGALRRLLTEALRRIPFEDGCLLSAAYGGERWPGTDAENLLFNNLDQTLSTFSRLGRDGVRFIDLGPTPPPAPEGSGWSSYYRFAAAASGSEIEAELGRLICRVPEVVVPVGDARLAARILVGVRQARPAQFTPAPGEPYVLRVRAGGLNAATHVKAVVDGVSAALQSWGPAPNSMKR